MCALQLLPMAVTLLLLTASSTSGWKIAPWQQAGQTCTGFVGIRLPKRPHLHMLQLRGGSDVDGDDKSTSAMQRSDTSGRNTSNVNIVFMGHVDSGKSTISGHILYETGGLDDRTLEKFEREAKAIGRESWKYAWAMDTTDEERAKGKTQECGRAAFKTEFRHYTIIDAPGHKNFVPFMIGGASQADVGILVVSARSGEFEAGFDRGGQTREHAVLAKTAGVGTLIVAVNKMDEASWDKGRYDDIQERLEPFLKQAGFNMKTQVIFIPLEGLSGRNLKTRIGTDVCTWYNGPSLLELLDSIQISPLNSSGPLRISVADRYREADLYVTGKLFSGMLNKGQQVLCMPSGVSVQVIQIIVDNEELDKATAGDNVQIRLRCPEDDVVKAGSVLCMEDAPCPVVTTMEVKLNVLSCKNILSAGYMCMMHIHNALVECTWTEVLAIIDRKSAQPVPGKRQPFVRVGQQANIRVQLSEPVCAQTYKDLASLGRFIMREEGTTVAVGVITSIS